MDDDIDVEEFYKQRLATFEVEREIFNQYVQSIKPNKGELHLLDWEYRNGIENAAALVNNRENEASNLNRLQKEISHKAHELKALRGRQETRIAQIQRLSELSHPVERDTTYIIPDRFAARENMNLYSGVLVTNSKAVNAKGGKQNLLIKTLRTTEIMQLEHKLEEETRKLTAGRNELDLALKEVSLGTKALDAVVMQSLEHSRDEAGVLVDEVDKLDVQGFLAVSELLHLRLKIMKAQREEIEELAQLRSDRQYFGAKEKDMRHQLLTDMNLMKKRLKAEAANSTKDFHSQYVSLDHLLAKLKKRNKALSEEVEKHDGSTEKLERIEEVAKQRYLKLKTRHALEMEGYHNEAKMLKDRLKKLEVQAAKEGIVPGKETYPSRN
jgi:hypothetical protein